MVHAVLARHAPDATVVDVTHHIRPYDVRGGALTLWRAVPWLVPGVILAVVDPGVGTDRRPIAVRTADALLVGPDSGLLFPAISRLGGALDAVELPPAPDSPGATFHGRDIFAPAAGRLAAGEDLRAVGRPIDPLSLAGEDVPHPHVEADASIRTEILWIDHFGNAQLNVTAAAAGGTTAVRIAGRTVPVRITKSYAAIGDDPVALVVDSYGLLSICAYRGSAGSQLGLSTGQPVWLCRDGDGRR